VRSGREIDGPESEESNCGGHRGASGIGRASALAFAAEGAHVAVWDLNEKVEQVAQEIRTQFRSSRSELSPT